MARPRYDKDQQTAEARLKAAFWELLGEMKYDQITVKKLSQRAQVNPNTFYYHYETRDDLALEAFNEEKLEELPAILYGAFLTGDTLSSADALDLPSLRERWKKLRLLIKSDSATLRQYVYTALETAWLSLIGIPKEALSREDFLDLTFILHGAISVIDQQAEEFELSFLATLPERTLGRGILQTLADLAEKYQ